MDLYRYLAIIAYLVATITGLIVIYFTWQIYKIKRLHAGLEKDIAQKRLDALNDEGDIRKAILDQTTQITTEISQSISQKLIDNPSWLDRFMDQTGITYSASVYGKRIGHFFYEKRSIAKEAVNKVEEYIKQDDSKRYCLLIDSGTTMYPFFQEIANRLSQKSAKQWREKVCIVTNNLPGLQYLMKNARDDPNDDYSELSISCFLVPGKPLSVYAAITGTESEKWLRGLKDFLRTAHIWRDSKPDVTILGFVTGNYMARKLVGDQVNYWPVARGEGHVEIKRTMVEISDQVLLLAPLMKFSFATTDLLNQVNGFNIDRKDLEMARRNPRKVKYEEIPIPDDKKPIFFTTRRPSGCMFETFGQALHFELVNRYKPHSVVMPEFNIRYWDVSFEDNRHIETQREIPHFTLREQYEKGANIWDQNWVLDRVSR